MAAPQQNTVPIYKDSYGVPRPDTAYQRMDARDTPGYALANLLGALPDAAKVHQAKTDEQNVQTEQEKQQLAALAKIGADKTNLRIAKGDSVFGLLKSKDTDMDSYELSRGQTDAELWAGGLRDRYNASGLSKNDDPAAFKAFVDNERTSMMKEVGGKDAAYYHGFVTKVSTAFEDVGVAHAGHLDAFIPAKRKQAAEMTIEAQTQMELKVMKEKTAVGQFLTVISQGEGAGNYNAFHNHAGNQDIRFTDMTIDEVLKWQSSNEWKRLGGGSSAVGKHQFIEGTLRETVRAAGLDPKTTKFTPQVQDQLIMTRLLKTRGLDDYLSGKISVEEFIDGNGKSPKEKGFRGGLKHELASIQGTDGRGQYDGDGKNHASVTSRTAIAAALALKEAVLRDPASLKLGKDGVTWEKIIGNAEAEQAENPQVKVKQTIEKAEIEHGVSQKEARDYAANGMVKYLEANPLEIDRVDLEDYMSDWKLSQPQRQKIVDVRDRLKSETEATGALQERQRQETLVKSAADFVRSGDPASIAALKETDYDAYNQLLKLQTGVSNSRTIPTDRKTYLANTDMFDEPDFASTALNDYLHGAITKDTYVAALDHFNTVQTAKPVLELPGVDDLLDTIEVTLPPTYQKQFRKALATSIADLVKRNNGERPSLGEVFDEVSNLHARYTQIASQKVQSAKDRLTAQDQQATAF